MLKNLRNTKALVELPEMKGLPSAVRAGEGWLALQTPSRDWSVNLGSQQQELQQWSEPPEERQQRAPGSAGETARRNWGRKD